jgi:hypothetical protein
MQKLTDFLYCDESIMRPSTLTVNFRKIREFRDKVIDGPRGVAMILVSVLGNQAIGENEMAAKKKIGTSSGRAQKIIDAARELHEACYEAWHKDDDLAFDVAFSTLKRMEDTTLQQGKELIGWSGGCLSQSGAIVSAIKLLETYHAHKK